MSIITGLTPAEIAALTTADIAGLTTTDIAEFTNAQIPALTSAQIQALSVGNIAAFSTVQFPAFTTGQIAAMTADQVAAIETDDIAVMTKSQVAAIDAAANGAGVTRCLSYPLHDYLRTGRLRRVLHAYDPPSTPVHVVYRERRNASMRVRSFVSYVVDRLREHPAMRPDG
mgnify:CR=1 FL=1